MTSMLHEILDELFSALHLDLFSPFHSVQFTLLVDIFPDVIQTVYELWYLDEIF